MHLDWFEHDRPQGKANGDMEGTRQNQLDRAVVALDAALAIEA